MKTTKISERKNKKNNLINEDLFDTNNFFLTEDDEPKENDGEKEGDGGMSDQELKVKCVDIATNIAKLMNDVTPEDILTISRKVANFIKVHEIGSTYDPDNEFADDVDKKDEATEDESEKDLKDGGSDAESEDNNEFTIDDFTSHVEQDNKDEELPDTFSLDDEDDEETKEENANETSEQIPQKFII